MGASSSPPPGPLLDQASSTFTLTAGVVCFGVLWLGGHLISSHISPRTGLQGAFCGCDAERARLCEVVDCRGAVQDQVSLEEFSANGTTCRQVSVPVMSEPSGDWFTFQPASPAVFCRNPFLKDPYEQLFVQVTCTSLFHFSPFHLSLITQLFIPYGQAGESRIFRAGQGLFARCDIEEGTVISFYNGVSGWIVG